MSVPNIHTTFGSLLIGALFTSLLSGISNLQTLHYYRYYEKDPARIKVLVFLVWALDNVHTVFIWCGLWYYFIGNYAKADQIDVIPWTISLNVLLTALITVMVHGFLIHRIFLLSNKNWFMTAPALVLTVFRLACASVTTSRMLEYRSFETLKVHARWIFTLGLAVSSTVDVLICGLLVYLFRSNRTEAGRLNHVLDKLVLYGLESGSLTCIGTILSMLCWLAIPQNLIFLGVYFTIAKLYANSLFITLNTRNSIHPGNKTCTCEPKRPIMLLEPPSFAVGSSTANSAAKISPDLEINVETQTNVQYDTSSLYSLK